PGRCLLGEPALQQRGEAAAELDHLESARNLAERVREHLAVLGREQAGEILTMRVEELADAEEELGAPPQRERTPLRESTLRGLDSSVALLSRRKVAGPRPDA